LSTAAGWACAVSGICDVVYECLAALQGNVQSQKECGKEIGAASSRPPLLAW
jgi:hypothetical protein